MYYPCSKNKGAYQLRIGKNLFFGEKAQIHAFIFQIQELLNGHVHISDKDYVGKILEKMIKDGPDKLQVSLY